VVQNGRLGRHRVRPFEGMQGPAVPSRQITSSAGNVQNTRPNGTFQKSDLLQTGRLDPFLDPPSGPTPNLPTGHAPSRPWRSPHPKRRLGAPGAGQVTFSDRVRSSRALTHFARRSQIRGGKFRILAVAPPHNQNGHSGTRSGSGDPLRSVPFKSHTGPHFEGIPNLKREI
jgi:hypothetical protein